MKSNNSWPYDRLRRARRSPKAPCLISVIMVLSAMVIFLGAGGVSIAQEPVIRAALPHVVRDGENGAWLGYGYLCQETSWSQVPKVALRMKNDYRIRYWFLNVGTLDGTGRLKGSVSTVTNFLNAVKPWEIQQHHQFKILAWLNANADMVDITDPAVRSNIVGECTKLVSTTAPGSYVAGASRAFDGMQLDIEPAGEDANHLAGFVDLFDQIRASYRSMRMGDKLTSFTPSKWGTRNKWWSSPQFYYTLGGHVDLLCAMTYDTGITNAAVYQGWMQDQTTNILKSVSGRYWNNDAQHPAPKSGVKVMFGLPAFPNNKYHTNIVENISHAAPGVKAGLADLQAHRDISVRYFQGAAVYLLTDGSGGDGYSNYLTDWLWFQQYWLDGWKTL